MSSPLTDLLKELDQSDFGVFVFAAEDITVIRGLQASAVRDNVLFELGLFTGKLGPERSFFLIPDQHSDLRLPTDLAAVMPLKYESSRTDKNWSAAVNLACAEITKQIQRLSFSPNRLKANQLIELATQYESCGWIEDESKRVPEKNRIFRMMCMYLGDSPVNKTLLLEQHRLGYYVALAATILENPTLGDSELICQIHQWTNFPLHAQHRILDAVKKLIDEGKATPNQKKKMLSWAKTLQNKRGDFVKRIADMEQNK
jgi:hypothetical protein